MSFRIHQTPLRKISEFPYQRAAATGGTEVARLPVFVGSCEGLPPELDGLLLTSDLQGIDFSGRLLGMAAAEYLEDLGDSRQIPRAPRLGVLLAGDLYAPSSARERGGYGSVKEVWEAFADRFAWVAGVAGNHDDARALERDSTVALLDGTYIELGDAHADLRIGGVGRIASTRPKVGRRTHDEQETLLRRLLSPATPLDVLVLHEGPHGSDPRNFPGSEAITALLDERKNARPPLLHCGHVAGWEHPITWKEECAIVNTDGKVVLFVQERPRTHSSLTIA